MKNKKCNQYAQKACIYDKFNNIKKRKKRYIPAAQRGTLLFVYGAPLIERWIKMMYDAGMACKITINRNLARKRILQDVPGCLDYGVNKRIKGKVYRCFVFYAKKVPRGLLELLND